MAVFLEYGQPLEIMDRTINCDQDVSNYENR